MKDEESYYVHVPGTVLLQMKLTLHDVCYFRFTNQMYFMSQMKTAFPQYLFSSSKICLPQHRHLLQVVHRLFHVAYWKLPPS